MKKLLAFGLFCLLYLTGGALLQQCKGPLPLPEAPEFVIEKMDFVVQHYRADTLNPGQHYHRDSVMISARFRQVYYTQTASLWSPIPTSQALSYADPQSRQRLTDLQLTLLDSLQLADGTWLLPQSNVNVHFDIVQAFSDYRVPGGIASLITAQPKFSSPQSFLRLLWKTPLAQNSRLRLSTLLQLDDGQVFRTPVAEPLQLFILGGN